MTLLDKITEKVTLFLNLSKKEEYFPPAIRYFIYIFNFHR